MTKERPILFSAPMVEAIRAGRKTMTRRAIRPQPDPRTKYMETGVEREAHRWWPMSDRDYTGTGIRCPYGEPGDRLRLLSSWATDKRFDEMKPKDLPIGGDVPTEIGRGGFWSHWSGGEKPAWCGKLRPGRFLPSSLRGLMPLAEITAIGVEPLHDISEEDARAEGVEDLHSPRAEGDGERDESICRRCGGTRLHNGVGPGLGVIFDIDCAECDTYRKRFRNIWHHINGAESWAENPWVWVVSFKLAEPVPCAT